VNARRGAERVSRALLYGGTALAVVAVGAWVLDVIPDVPEWMLRIAVYKLALGSGLGLMIAGAVLRRSLRETPAPAGRAVPPALGEGNSPPIPPPHQKGERAAERRDS